MLRRAQRYAAAFVAALSVAAGCDVTGVPDGPLPLRFTTVRFDSAGPSDLLLADLDGDGHVDLAGTGKVDPHTMAIVVRRGDGERGFGAESFDALDGVLPGAVVTSSGLAAGDLDGDGRPDLITVIWDGGPLVWARSRGHLAFDAPAVLAADPCLARPSALAVGDLGGGRGADIAVIAEGDRSANVFYARGAGSVSACMAYSIGDARSDSGALIADLDGDGRADVAALSSVASEVALLPRASPKGFAAPVAVPTGPAPNAMAAGDVDGDGLTDSVTTHSLGRTLSVHLNRRAGRFYTIDVPVDFAPESVALADLDGDGALDAAVTGGSMVHVLRGDGAGSFAPAASRPVDDTSGVAPLRAVDVDGDGRLDLVTGSSSGRSVTVLFNDAP